MVALISYVCLCTFNLYIYSFLCKKFSPVGTVSSVTFYINTWPWICTLLLERAEDGFTKFFERLVDYVQKILLQPL
jgi:hypothetical protein